MQDLQQLLQSFQELLSNINNKMSGEKDKEEYKQLLAQRRLLNSILDDILKLNSLQL